MHYDTQHNVTQYYDIRYYETKHFDTQHQEQYDLQLKVCSTRMLKGIMLSVIMFGGLVLDIVAPFNATVCR
jgi:hypothetical protein